jgi:myo-inositol-1-phosphate synthase
MNSENKVRVAIAGIGNVASALVQAIQIVKELGDSKRKASAQIVAGFRLEDIEFVLGFDVNRKKVGSDLANAIFCKPNNAKEIYRPAPIMASVLRGPLEDGIPPECSAYVPVDSNAVPVDIVEALKLNRVDVLCIALPAGAMRATRAYALAGIEAGCAILNGTANPVANDSEICQLSVSAGIPVIGDDSKSQLGATILHRALMKLFRLRNANILATLQLDWGGDMDFANMVLGKRYELGKRNSKTKSVKFEHEDISDENCRVSAVEYFPFMKNRKDAYIRMDGEIFGGASVKIDIKMEVDDAFNAAGVQADAIRVLCFEKNAGFGGALAAASAAFSKLPPVEMDDEAAIREIRSKYGYSES